MEATQEKKKIGNPNFGKKTKEKVGIDKNIYYFQLIKSYEREAPRDRDTGELTTNPYPVIFMLPNGGVALDSETGEYRRWRYVYGYDSIWEDEQIPTPSKLQLEDQRNYIEFRKGLLKVVGTNKALLKALLVQDSFEGNEIPVENVPKLFRQVDETADLIKEGEDLDIEYKALKFANESDMSEMLPVAMALGIDVSNAEEDAPQIRIKFLKKAKENPKAFVRQTLDPRNKIKYIMTMALQKGIISGSVKEHELVMVDTGVGLFPINSFKDISEQLTTMVMSNDDKATKLYEQLKKQI